MKFVILDDEASGVCHASSGSSGVVNSCNDVQTCHGSDRRQAMAATMGAISPHPDDAGFFSESCTLME